MSEVINAGVGGNTTRALLKRLEKDVLTKEPSLVVLKVGTNDALNSGALVPITEYRENLAKLCDAIRMRSQLLLCTILPFHLADLMARHKAEAYGDLPPAERLQQVNRIIRDTADARHIPVVDLHRIFHAVGLVGEDKASLVRNEANSGAHDGVHPTPEGYRVMAVAIYEAIVTLNLDTKRIVCFGDSITLGAGAKGSGTVEGETYPARLKQMLSAE